LRNFQEILGGKFYKKNFEKFARDLGEIFGGNFEKLADARLESVMAHMKELEDCDDLNMRQFLMKYIIPLLTEGMIEVWKVGPLDPVDYLADYIFKRSQNV